MTVILHMWMYPLGVAFFTWVWAIMSSKGYIEIAHNMGCVAIPVSVVCILVSISYYMGSKT